MAWDTLAGMDEENQLSESAMRSFQRRTGPLYPTLAAEVVTARAQLTLAESVTLAVRARRHDLRLSQRAYAERLGWSKTQLAQLEADPERLRLSLVLDALEDTAYRLALLTRGGEVMDPADWPTGELVARTVGGGRFAGHRTIRRTQAPAWWVMRHECEYPRPQPPAWTAGVG